MSLLLAIAIAAHPPQTLAPGRSLGGIRLGDPPARVTALWGRTHGVCRSCTTPSWFYNEKRFQPQGLGITFRHSRVAAVYTLWQPRGWRTTAGLATGDAAAAMTATYGALARVACPGYDTYLLGSRTRIYVRDDVVWGFGLTVPSEPTCREARA